MIERVTQPEQLPTGGIREGQRKKLEITPEESEIMDKYVELQPKLHDVGLSKDERSATATGLQDLIVVCAERAKGGESFWIEMLAQVSGASDEYFAIMNAVDAYKAAEHMRPEDAGFIEVIDVAYDMLKKARGLKLSEEDFSQMIGELYRKKQEYLQLRVRGA